MLEINQQLRARNDLKKIWQHSFDEWGENQANKYLRELNAGLEQLKDNP